MKNDALKILFAIAGAFMFLLLFGLAFIVYGLNYAVSDVDSSYGKTKEEYYRNQSSDDAANRSFPRLSSYRTDHQNTSDATKKSDAEEVKRETDEDGYPMSEEYQAYKKQLAAIAAYINPQAECRYYINAKGYPYAEIDPESANSDGTDSSGDAIIVVRKLIWNENYWEEGFEEYVYEECYYDAEGNEVKSARILDFYLVDTDTLMVTDENKKTW